jgi:hypothetical protein
MPLIFNLQTVSTVHRRCRTSHSRPDIVGCGREVAERAQKATSAPKTKKKDEPPMKLLDDPKIPATRKNPWRPHHSHKLLDVAVKMGLKSGRLYWRRRRRRHLSAAPPNLHPKTRKMEPSRWRGLRSTELGRSAASTRGGWGNLIASSSPPRAVPVQLSIISRVIPNLLWEGGTEGVLILNRQNRKSP